MGEWTRVRLGDLIDVKHGYAFKGEFFHDEPPGDFLLTPGNFAIGGGFQWGKRKFYRDGPVPADYVLEPGDILITMTDLSKVADTLGYSAVVPESDVRLLHNQRLGKVILKSTAVDKSYIHWLLRTPDYRNEILASYTGSTVKHTSPKKILAYAFSLPSLSEQGQIVAVLDALDDKIELNRRMNETLEAMARALFKDWFVDFGPTRAKMEGRAPYLTPELWDLFPDALDDEDKPVGWESYALRDLAHHHRTTVSPSANPESPFEHYSIPAYDAGNEPMRDSGASIKSNKTVVPESAVLLSKLNPEIERVWLPNPKGKLRQISSTEFLAFTPLAPATRTVLFCMFKSEEFRAEMAAMVTGTSKSHQRVSPKALLSREVLVADARLLAAFDHMIRPFLARLLSNRREARTLAQTRDLLLPKLMSGKIRLAEAEKAVEAVA